MMRKLTLSAVALAVSTVIGSPASHATFTVEGWLDEPAAALNPTITVVNNLGVAARDFVVTREAINFTAPVGGMFTVGAFLGPAGLGGIATQDLTNTVLRVTGTAVTDGPPPPGAQPAPSRSHTMTGWSCLWAGQTGSLISAPWPHLADKPARARGAPPRP